MSSAAGTLKQRSCSHFSDMSASSGGALPSAPVKHPRSPEFCSMSSRFLRDLTCFERRNKKKKPQMATVASLERTKVFTGCHKFPGTKPYIDNKPGCSSSHISWSLTEDSAQGSKLISPSTQAGKPGLRVERRVKREGSAPPPHSGRLVHGLRVKANQTLQDKAQAPRCLNKNNPKIA